MRTGQWLLGAFSAATILSVGMAAAGPLPRDALYAVVRTCVLAKASLGTSFPCLDVEAATATSPGYAVVRAPGNETHVIVTPTAKISGIEDPSLLSGNAGAYWRAALAARSYVQTAAGSRVALPAIGLAINSRATRSQDQLHIHAECLLPAVLGAVGAEIGRLDATWQELPHPLDLDRFVGRLVTRHDVEAGNLFAVLGTMPGAKGDLSGTVALLVEDVRGRGERFALLATRTRSRSVEGVFDDDCKAAKRMSSGG